MVIARWVKFAALGALVAAIAAPGTSISGHSAVMQPTNDAPNPYQSIEGWAKLPEGRTWGSTSAVDVDKDGKSIWVGERCGTNSCLDRAAGKMSDLPTILNFDANGKLVQSFGAGMLIFPHGIHVDRDGNIWVTDGQDNGQRRAALVPAARRAAVRRQAADARAAKRRRVRSVRGQVRRWAIRFSSSAPTANCCSRSVRPAEQPHRNDSTSPTTS
jgi:hypothetical protein